jgi:thiol:disulfide interchange protein DsbD
LKASERVLAGSPVELALHFKLAPGWHTYWSNPGEAGMPISVEWDLPEGWVAGPLLYPAPQRFTTGEVVGFGYGKEVVLPVFVTAAADAEGPARIAAEVRWLTCNDAQCVPGKASLETTLEIGVAAPTADAERIAEALAEVPKPVTDTVLSVVDRQEVIELSLAVPGGGMDLTKVQVFPLTPEVIDPAQEIRFERAGDRWLARVAASDYVERPIEELQLVITGAGVERPQLVSWKPVDR